MECQHVNNVFATDGVNATATVATGNQNIDYLVASGFGFNLPSSAIITGVTANLVIGNSAGTTQVNQCQLVKNGVIGGTPQTKAGSFRASPNDRPSGRVNQFVGPDSPI